jgi:glycosyltransferase involved in cell wall biosynthesis
MNAHGPVMTSPQRPTGTNAMPTSWSQRTGAAVSVSPTSGLVTEPLVRPADPLLSLVVPVYNEAESVQLFFDTCRSVLDAAAVRFEVVFVNDGSRDETRGQLLRLGSAEPRLRLINLSRNFGKEIALSAGLDFARGDVVVPIDVDLQDPPQLIIEFLAQWRNGYDVVYGIRGSRSHDGFAKRATSAWFYRLFNRVSNTEIPADVGDFRLLDRRVVDTLNRMSERNRFMKGLFAWVGFPAIGICYDRPARAAGATKWNHWRLWNFALDGFVGFSTAPLRIWAYLGASVAMLALLYGSFIVVRTLMFGIDVPGYASLLAAVLFLGGLQLLSIGVIGEYLRRLFVEVKARPLYIVESSFPTPMNGTDL